MKSNLIQAWKNADKSANAKAPVANPNIDESMLTNSVNGGAQSAGYVCTLSGECNGGKSCWDVVRDLIGAFG